MNEKYIMTEFMYDSLTNVYGFTDLNGKTYQEHITKIFADKIDEKLKKQILKVSSAGEALKILSDNNIDYTHTLE